MYTYVYMYMYMYMYIIIGTRRTFPDIKVWWLGEGAQILPVIGHCFIAKNKKTKNGDARV